METKRFLMFFISSAFLLSGSLHAQDVLSAEEILQWFPYGFYSQINHKDLVRLERGEAYTLYREYLLQPDLEPGIEMLLESLRGEVESYTTARLLKLKKKKLSPDSLPELKGKKGENIKVTFLANEGEGMAVFRFAVLDPLLEDAQKKGQVEETGESVNGRPIISFRTREDGEEYFAYAEATGELVVASKLPLLRAMIASGTGQDLNLLDEESYIGLIDSVPELGQIWHFHSARSLFDYMLEKRKNEGEEESAIAAWKDSFEKGPQFTIEHTIVGEQIVQRRISSYVDDEAAERAINSESRHMVFGEGAEAIRDHFELLEKSAKTEQDGNLVIKTIVHDDELLESARASNKALADIMKKRGDTGSKERVVIVSKADK